MRDPVWSGTVAAITNSENEKSSKSIINLSYFRSEYPSSGSRNCHGKRMIRGRDVVVDGTTQTGTGLF